MRLYERMGFRRLPELDFEPAPAVTVKGYRLTLGRAERLSLGLASTLTAAGCATSQTVEEVPLPAEARGYGGRTGPPSSAASRRVEPSHAANRRKPDAEEFDPRVRADARSFLTLCRVPPG